MAARSNTAENSERGKPFSKGDPRINRKGRPRSFDALRELAQQIAHEEAKDKNGNPLIASGRKITIAEAILRKWAGDPKYQAHFIEISFGKVPIRQEITGEDSGPIDINIKLTSALKTAYDDSDSSAATDPDA